MSKNERYFVWALVALYVLTFSVYSIERHNRYNSSALDLAIQDNVLWNTAQGHWFRSSIETSNYLGDHITLTIPIYSLLYFLWEDVRIILVFQSLLLGSGALAVARLAHLKIDRLWAGPAFALAYLLYPPVGFINRFDFHPEVAVVPLFLFAILTFEMNKNLPGYLLTLLVVLSKEQMGAVVGIWGLSMILFEKKYRRGTIFMVVGFAWSYIALFHLIPHFRGGPSDTLQRYDQAAVEVLLSLFSGPNRKLYLWRMLWPVAGLCLLAPRAFLVAAFVLLYNLASNNINQHSIFYQYNAPAIPWIFWGSILAVNWLLKRKSFPGHIKNRLVYCLPITCALAFLIYNPFTTVVRPPHFEVYGWKRLGNEEQITQASRLVPPDSEIATTMALLPHFSHRRGAYLWWGGAYLDSEYILVNLFDHRWNGSWGDYMSTLKRAIEEHHHKAIYFENGVVLTENQKKKRDATQEVLRFIDTREVDKEIAVAFQYVGDTRRTGFASGRIRTEFLQEGRIATASLKKIIENDRFVDFEWLPSGKALALTEKGYVISEKPEVFLGDCRGSFPIYVDLELAGENNGYYILDRFGRVSCFGSAEFFGDDFDSTNNGRAVALVAAPDGRGYTILRSHGVLKSFGSAKVSEGDFTPFGWDIARKIVLTGPGRGYLLDGFGGIHALGSATPLRTQSYTNIDRMVDIALKPEGGVELLDQTGDIHSTVKAR